MQQMRKMKISDLCVFNFWLPSGKVQTD